MTDFFRLLGKAFAIVFGSTSALALVLGLSILAVRPLLRPYQQSQGPQPEHGPASQPDFIPAQPVTITPDAEPQSGPETITPDAEPQSGPVHVTQNFKDIAPIGSVCSCSDAGCYICDWKKKHVDRKST